jgi:hypothetical protein
LLDYDWIEDIILLFVQIIVYIFSSCESKREKKNLIIWCFLKFTVNWDSRYKNMFICIYSYVCTRINVCILEYVHIYIYICMDVYLLSVPLRNKKAEIYIYVYTYIKIYICICIHIYMYIYTHMYMYIYICTQTNIYT